MSFSGFLLSNTCTSRAPAWQTGQVGENKRINLVFPKSSLNFDFKSSIVSKFLRAVSELDFSEVGFGLEVAVVVLDFSEVGFGLEVAVVVLISFSWLVSFSEHAIKRGKSNIMLEIVTQSSFRMRCMFSLLIRSVWHNYDNCSLRLQRSGYTSIC